MTARSFFESFTKRKGVHMLFGSGLIKLLGFVSVLIVTNWTSEHSFGSFSYAQSLINAFVPLMGVGAFQSFIRFGADLPDELQRRRLYAYAYSRGMVLSIVISIALYLSANLFCAHVPESGSVFRVLAFTLVSTLFMEYVKSFARSIHRNDYSAWIDVGYALWLLLLSVVLTHQMSVVGYALAILISPLLAAIPFAIRMRVSLLAWPSRVDNVPRGFWRYGIFISLGAITGQMFYAVDYYQMGRLIPDSDSVIALYRVSGIVPLALLIIPITISATDFVSNSEGKSDAKVLRAYVVGYWRLMVWLVPLLMLVVGLLTPFVLGLFGDYYASSPELMYVLLVGVTGGFFLRVPFGNLLSAVGRADINTYVNIAVLILSFFAFEYAIVCAGIWGLAVAMASMIWLSGLISLFFFYRYYKRLG